MIEQMLQDVLEMIDAVVTTMQMLRDALGQLAAADTRRERRLAVLEARVRSLERRGPH